MPIDPRVAGSATAMAIDSARSATATKAVHPLRSASSWTMGWAEVRYWLMNRSATASAPLPRR